MYMLLTGLCTPPWLPAHLSNLVYSQTLWVCANQQISVGLVWINCMNNQDGTCGNRQPAVRQSHDNRKSWTLTGILQRPPLRHLTYTFPREGRLLWNWPWEEGTETNSSAPLSATEWKSFRTPIFSSHLLVTLPGSFCLSKAWHHE